MNPQLELEVREFLSYLSGTTDVDEGIQLMAKELHDKIDGKVCVVKGKAFTFDQLEKWIDSYNNHSRYLTRVGHTKATITAEIMDIYRMTYSEAENITEAILRLQRVILSKQLTNIT